MGIPDTLDYKLRQFRHSGRVVKYAGDLFAASNWIAVLMGQEVWPERYDALVDQRDLDMIRTHLAQVRGSVARAAQLAPRHEEYLASASPRDA